MHAIAQVLDAFTPAECINYFRIPAMIQNDRKCSRKRRRVPNGFNLSVLALCGLAVAGIFNPGLAQTPAIDPQIQVKASNLVNERVTRFEKFVFRDEETIPLDFDRNREFHYMLLGYAGYGSAFNDFMFSAPFLSYARLSGIHVNMTNDPKSADIIAVLTDTGPEKGAIHENLRAVMGIDAGADHHETVLFSGECYLSQLFIDHHLARTIVALNVLRVKDWLGSDDQKTADAIIPGACLAAGIASHLGVHAVTRTTPDQFITISEGKPFFVGPVYFILTLLYESGITGGMTRAQAKERLSEYLKPRAVYQIMREQNNEQH